MFFTMFFFFKTCLLPFKTCLLLSKCFLPSKTLFLPSKTCVFLQYSGVLQSIQQQTPEQFIKYIAAQQQAQAEKVAAEKQKQAAIMTRIGKVASC